MFYQCTTYTQESTWIISMHLGELSQTEYIQIIHSWVKTQNSSSTSKLPHSFPPSHPNTNNHFSDYSHLILLLPAFEQIP